MNDSTLASANSLRGQLQRGRGKGYWRLLVEPAPKARRLITDCILNDPRLDRQIESRAEYYAALAWEIGLDLSPLAERLRSLISSDEGDTSLVLDTLGALAKWGHEPAANVVCDYLAWGEHWERSLDDLTSSSLTDLPGRVARVIEARFPNDVDLANALDWCFLTDAPWPALAAVSKRIQNLAREPNSRSRAVQENQELKTKCLLPSISDARQLLEMATPQNAHLLSARIKEVVQSADQALLLNNVTTEQTPAARVALAGLAQLANPELFGWSRDFYLSLPLDRAKTSILRRSVVKYMTRLPPALTLPLARAWLHQESDPQRWLAESLIKVHAAREDVGLIRASLTAAITDEVTNCYRICNLVEALEHIPHLGAVPELAEVFVQFQYSYGRSLAARAMAATDPEGFAEEFAFECLWDCQSASRALGARLVSSSGTWARFRLQQLQSDPAEEEEVREVAQSRN